MASQVTVLRVGIATVAVQTPNGITEISWDSLREAASKRNEEDLRLIYSSLLAEARAMAKDANLLGYSLACGDLYASPVQLAAEFFPEPMRGETRESALADKIARQTDKWAWAVGGDYSLPESVVHGSVKIRSYDPDEAAERIDRQREAEGINAEIWRARALSGWVPP